MTKIQELMLMVCFIHALSFIMLGWVNLISDCIKGGKRLIHKLKNAKTEK